MCRRADGAVREVAKNLMFSTQIKGKSDHDAFTDGFPRRCSKTTRSVPIGGLEREPIDVSQVDVSMNGIELQDREFVAAIREGREPNSSVAKVLDCYRVIGELAADLESQDGWS